MHGTKSSTSYPAACLSRCCHGPRRHLPAHPLARLAAHLSNAGMQREFVLGSSKGLPVPQGGAATRHVLARQQAVGSRRLTAFLRKQCAASVPCGAVLLCKHVPYLDSSTAPPRPVQHRCYAGKWLAPVTEETIAMRMLTSLPCKHASLLRNSMPPALLCKRDH